jgi:hypothetical protein
MTRLTPIQIDENTLIYIESTDNLEIPAETLKTEGRVAKRGTSIPDKQQILQNFQTIEDTIRTYTKLNGFYFGSPI